MNGVVGISTIIMGIVGSGVGRIVQKHKGKIEKKHIALLMAW